MGLRAWLCQVSKPHRDDNTREVIHEAEMTRAELESLTGRLGEYVSDLRALIRTELRQKNEGQAP